MKLSQKEIKEQLIEQLQKEGCRQEHIDENESLLLSGLNSIVIMKILSSWAKRGYKIPFSELIRHPYINDWAEILFHSDKEQLVKQEASYQVNMYEPFDLTDMQYAYWIGRNKNQKLGGVGCHGYFEVDCLDLDINRLEEAWQVLFAYHPMLRACFTKDGKQKILKEPYHKHIEVFSLDDLSPAKREEKLLKIREERSHRLLDIENGEVISLIVTKWGRQYRMHFEIDLLVCDVESFAIILHDLATYYLKKERPQVEKEWNFAQYLKERKEKLKKDVALAKLYWDEHLLNLPDGPKLPMKKLQNSFEQLKFCRHTINISKQEMNILMKKGSDNGVTLAIVLLTAYGLTISKWSKNKHFLLNMPLFDRDESVKNVVADFTNLLLVDMDYRERKSFAQYLKQVQKSFFASMDHSALSGVKLLRELRKKKNEDIDASIVFSCNLGRPIVSQTFKDAFHDITYMISQTPQVLIDFQAFNAVEGLTFIWDAADQMFPNGMVEEIFQCFITLIHQLANEKTDWTQIYEVMSSSQKKHYQNAQDFTFIINEKRNMLVDIFSNIEKYPNNIALIQPEKESITYHELGQRVKSIAAYLQAKGIKKGDYIAVLMPRGINCIIAEIAILAVGGIYIPISIDHPELRRNAIIATAHCKAIIVSEEIKHLTNIMIINYDIALKSAKTYYPVLCSFNDPAYVIFTSGSTGVPKGVEITHGAAMNTIDDVNKRYNVGVKDTAIGVSSNDFDLSVYDIFGILSAGGKLVVITNKEKRDALTWLSYIKKYSVTIWNSVPTLLKMLLVEIENEQAEINSLKTIILSGDWISLDIPKRVKKCMPNALLVSMGGATEASIWSNFFEVKEDIPSDWPSIPYGYPLQNQYYRVVGNDGIDCPDEVAGELWIGGAGIAKGYIGDPILTKQKFVENLGKRWYRTGDNGKFWQNGIIEFLGRRDNQIKLRGHRIELGEIESNLNSCRNIQQSVAMIYEKNGNKQLCAFVVGNNLVDLDEVSCLKQDQLVNISFPCYDVQKEVDIDEIMHQVAIDTARQMIHILADSVKEVRKSKYEKLYQEWQSLAKLSNDKHLDTYQKESYLLNEFAHPFVANVKNIILKDSNPNELLLNKDFISPSFLARNMPRGLFLLQSMLQIIEKLQDNEHAIDILEIGTRDLNTSEKLVKKLKKGTYTFLDKSLFFINQAKDKFKNNDQVKYIVANLNDDDISSSYDIIILNYTLHQFQNIDKVLHLLHQKQKIGGIILITEMIKESPMQKLTSSLLLLDNYTDLRKQTKKALLNNEQWLKIFTNNGFNICDVFKEEPWVKNLLSQTMYVILKEQNHLKVFDEAKTKAELSLKIPEYMVPLKIKCLTAFPLTANGKIDRQELLQKYEYWLSSKEEKKVELAQSETEKRLITLWQEVLDHSISRKDNYFRLGGDSLLATILASKIRDQFHLPFALENIFKYPVLCDMALAIDSLKMQNCCLCNTDYSFKEDKENAYEPFPLTDIQQAYWIGRNDMFNYSDVTTHCYFEMDCYDFDLLEAEKVWNEMIKTHGMLRAIILPNGEQQKILKQTKYYQLPIYNLQDNKHILKDLRKEMAQEQIDIYTWPLFDIRAVRINTHQSRLYISFDNIVLDGFSMFYLFHEWADLVWHKGKLPRAEKVSFRDYLLNYNALKKAEQYSIDVAYWHNKLAQIYPAPEFSVFLQDPKKAKKFKRFSYHLNEDKWLKITQKLQDHSLTKAVFLMGTYAEILSRWCIKPYFSINLTRFNRFPFGKDLSSTVGDYTSLTIHSIDLRRGKTFAERLQNIQKNLWTDLNHSLVSGIEVERMLNKDNGSGSMPVVFTCGLGLENKKVESKNRYPGKIIYGNSQTPQVWLDYQVYEYDGGLEISWDALIDIFPDGMIEDMFQAHISLLEKLADDVKTWSEMIPNIVNVNIDKQMSQINDTDRKFPDNTLVDLFLDSVNNFKDHIAIIDEQKTLTYGNLYQVTTTIAKALIAQGIKKQDVIAIDMDKGYKQVISALAILLIGGIYLPLNHQAPKARNDKIISLAKAKKVINQETWQALSTYSDNKQFTKINISPNDLAYIIYTSGTTGEPKGVAIEHQSVVNTILDINDRLKIQASDKTIAISDLSFDLSVYDIFGMLAVGGTIVLPRKEFIIEPSEWQKIVQDYGITIWNTVPMFMQMFTQYLKVHPFTKEIALKHILMSGDWIPLAIYKDVRETIGKASIYGLGGATEASIWSNIYEIKDINQAWRSIPYGKPLSNQKYFIFNEQLMDCPYDVIGDLYIAGKGLAREYWRNLQETKKAFIIHPRKKERLYRTGDRALIMRDGNIEFCGRNDGQVKISGFRIELGEIDNNIEQLENIDQAVSIVDNGEILSLVVCHKQIENIADEVQNYLVQRLPSYMIPKVIIQVKNIPFTANGKVDKKAIRKITQFNDQINEKDSDQSQWTTCEQEVADLWKEILGVKKFTKTDNFVKIGGDSLAAVQLVNKIVQKYRIEFMISDFYENLTVEKLAQFIERAKEDNEIGEI